ncbi:uncharacterized protein V1510DRAFT_161435 [Dipodascopsis tothii]|uniref:uncharacterized protein n=1 Tax=Dipodascopsis tothii TaxID=44089 RepID=UPI0034CE51D5
MPPPRKQKTFGADSRQKKPKKAFVPTTEDEILFVGSTEEDHGDRWANSDPAKAERFYLRALEYYRMCLERFPGSFDAAYNKCRLEFHVYQSFYPDTDRAMRDSTLQQILDDHRFALGLRDRPPAAAGPASTPAPLPAPSDLLFNTAQVVLTLAELRHDFDLFRQALELFERTWAVQWDEVYGDNAPASPSTDGDGEYATEIDPTTPTSLLETAVGQLTCLIPVYSIAQAAGRAEVWADETLRQAGRVAMERVVQLVDGAGNADAVAVVVAPDVVAEAAVAVARYICLSGFPALERPADVAGMVAVWAGTGPDVLARLPASLDRYMAQADSFSSYAAAVAGRDGDEAWRALGGADQALARALASAPTAAPVGRAPDTIGQMRAWAARGDVNLMRSQLRSSALAAPHLAVVRKNAEVYFRNCSKVGAGASAPETQTLLREARIKGLAAAGDWAAVRAEDGWQAVVGDAVDDGVLEADEVLANAQ